MRSKVHKTSDFGQPESLEIRELDPKLSAHDHPIRILRPTLPRIV